MSANVPLCPTCGRRLRAADDWWYCPKCGSEWDPDLIEDKEQP